MKRIHFIIVVLFATLFIGCADEPDALCQCEKIEINKKEYIAVCIVPEEVTINSTNKLIMENYTKKSIIDGVYHFEYFHENDWIVIEWDINFDAMARYIQANTVKEVNMDLYSFAEKYNNSKIGKYRISKQLGRYRVFAEFEIK